MREAGMGEGPRNIEGMGNEGIGIKELTLRIFHLEAICNHCLPPAVTAPLFREWPKSFYWEGPTAAGDGFAGVRICLRG